MSVMDGDSILVDEYPGAPELDLLLKAEDRRDGAYDQAIERALDLVGHAARIDTMVRAARRPQDWEEVAEALNALDESVSDARERVQFARAAEDRALEAHERYVAAWRNTTPEED